ncbi:MAG: tRNA (adenosine(37)-N6)-threonylcarbamoyltransferase complex ATPase subunit type 1 TsaE [Acidobacteria bacterium]|nr:tRNA (adenosine(37)-N6)-threonylcarbamoyltransferase complex ATPase subunit type 1 TsaE [Acidobacteriota bacterium]
MIRPFHLRTGSPEELEAVGRRFGETIDAPALVLLDGELGAGKTLFVRGMAAGLGKSPDEVTSPTFSLVNRYGTGRCPLVHLDLYRLDAATPESTARLVGLDDLLAEQAVVVVEWADRLEGLDLGSPIRVSIAYDGDDARIVDVRIPE